jgi:hypothetical protein
MKTVNTQVRPWQFSTKTLQIMDAVTAVTCLLVAAYLLERPSLGFWFWSWFMYGLFALFMMATKGTAAVQHFVFKFLRITIISRLLS